jgi:hypothetical protein
MIFGIDPRRYANTGVPQGNASIKTVLPVIGAEHRCRVSEKNHIVCVDVDAGWLPDRRSAALANRFRLPSLKHQDLRRQFSSVELDKFQFFF